MLLWVIAAVVAAGVLAYSFTEQFRLRVREIELEFPNLPPAFDGYTILHLSDLHITQLGLLERRLMELISAREVDTCLITGDVTSEPRASDIFRRVCSAIKHKDPIFTALGNSEHKPWLDTRMITEALSFEGNQILINSSAILRRGDDQITLVGVDDAYTDHADVDAAFAGVDPKGFIIFLTHCPSQAPKGIEKGADLILAGHTHGGQVRFPFIGMLWTHMRSNKNLNDGLYHLPQPLFVNRGVGTSKLHIRFLCPPEIAYITLRRTQAGTEARPLRQ